MYVIMLVITGRRITEIYPRFSSTCKAKLWPLPEIRRLLLTK
jgi:hypothetical protein